MGIETAIIGGVLGAAGSIGGAAIKKSAAEKAADVQLQGQREAIEAQRTAAGEARGFLQQQTAAAREELAPFRESQLAALQQLQGLADPESALAGQQRQRAQTNLQRQLSAQGLLRSGTQTRGLADIELGLEQQRAQLLGGLAGTGAVQASAGLTSQLGGQLAGIQTGLGQQIGSAFQAGGQVRGQQQLAAGRASGGLLSGLIGTAGGLAENIFPDPRQKRLADLQERALESLIGGGGRGVSQSQLGLLGRAAGGVFG